MRKREALKKALKWLPRLPKFSEWEKLFYTGLFICFGSIIAAINLTFATGNVWWLLLLVIGLLLYCWFMRASDILQDEEWKGES